MKLYDFGQAPNPRRVRIFLAEKGIKVPTEQVDIGTLQHRSESFAAHQSDAAASHSCPRRRHRDCRIDGDMPLL